MFTTQSCKGIVRGTPSSKILMLLNVPQDPGIVKQGSVRSSLCKTRRCPTFAVYIFACTACFGKGNGTHELQSDAGVIQLDRNGQAEVRSVGDEALSYLRRRADVSDLAVAPQPYQVPLLFPQPMDTVKVKQKLAVL